MRIGDDRWWLGDRTDRDAAAAPLADRVEWAVYSLLSTAGPMSEAQFLERIANLFTGPDLPDEALVRACLESYRSLASTPDRLLTADDVVKRSQEHGERIADLVDLGHRLGLRVLDRRGASSHAASVACRSATGSTTGSTPGRPRSGGIRGEELEDVDVIWYVRGRAALLWEVEWTAMLGEPVLRRHARMADDDRVVRFLVVLPERSELVRHKLDRSPLLRDALEAGSWHLHQGEPPPRLGAARRAGARGPRAAARPRPGRRADGRPDGAVRLTGSRPSVRVPPGPALP